MPRTASACCGCTPRSACRPARFVAQRAAHAGDNRSRTRRRRSQVLRPRHRQRQGGDRQGRQRARRARVHDRTVRRSARTPSNYARDLRLPDANALSSMLAEAELAPLVPAVARLTGDYTLLREDLRPDPALVLEPEGGLTEDQLAEIRELLFGALSRWREAGSPPAPDPTDDELRRLMAYLITDDGLRRRVLLRPAPSELAIERRRRPAGARLAPRTSIAPDTPFTVRLDRRRPGCRACSPRIASGRPGCRTSSSIKDADVERPGSRTPARAAGTTSPKLACAATRSRRRDDWPQHFSTQDVLLDYFRACADELGLRRAHPLRAPRCSRADFDDDDAALASCTVQRRRTGRSEIARRPARSSARSVSSTGRSMPDIAGPRHVRRARRSTRRGGTTTSTSHGRRVAVIGTGASAAQFIPCVAERGRRARRLPAHRRTGSCPTPQLPRRAARRRAAGCSRHVPVLRASGIGCWLFWRTHEGSAAGRRRRPGVARRRPLGQRSSTTIVRELFTAVPRDRVRRSPELLDAGRAELSARRQAQRARQRGVAGGR